MVEILAWFSVDMRFMLRFEGNRITLTKIGKKIARLAGAIENPKSLRACVRSIDLL